MADPRALPPAVPNDPMGALKFLAGKFEPALTLGSGMLDAGSAGLAGLGQLLTGQGADTAADTVRRNQGALTYAPRTDAGEQGVSALAGTLSDIGQTVSQAVPALDPAWRGEKAFELTGSPLAGALAETVEPTDLIAPGLKTFGVAGTMAGLRGARTLARDGQLAPLQALGLAEKMEQQGLSPERIWAATGEHFRQADAPYAGVVRGVDGQLRFEIPDDAAQILDGPAGTSELADVLSHDALLAAYPQMKSGTHVNFSLDLPEGDGYHIPAPEGMTARIGLSNWGDRDGSMTDTLLHETQHNVQTLEDFGAGGAPENFVPPRADIRAARALAKAGETVIPALDHASVTGLHPERAFAEVHGRPPSQDEMYAILNKTREELESAPGRWHALRALKYDRSAQRERYKRLAGEAEARQTERRRHLTLDERRARFPDRDFDRTREQQEVLRTSERPAFSLTDDAGAPLTFYHQTAQDFDTFKPGGFDPELSGPAIWFGGPALRGRLPAQHNAPDAAPGTRVLPVHLDMNNPLVVDADTLAWTRALFGDEFPQLISPSARAAILEDGYDGVLAYPPTGLAGDLGQVEEAIVFDPAQVRSIFQAPR